MVGHICHLTARAFLMVSPWGVCCRGRSEGALQNTEVPNLRYYWSGPVGTDNLGLLSGGTRLLLWGL